MSAIGLDRSLTEEWAIRTGWLICGCAATLLALAPVTNASPRTPVGNEASLLDLISPDAPRIQSSPPDGPRTFPELFASQSMVFVREIRLVGNREFPDADFDEILQRYENRKVRAEDLQQLRQAITQFYVERGYINSGALLPDQDIGDGVVTYEIVEGTLTEIDIVGNTRLHADYIRAFIDPEMARPLNVQRLQSQLVLLQQTPTVDRVDASLRPGLRPGQSSLEIKVEEARPYTLGLVLANDRSPNLGGERTRLFAVHHNLAGFGDSVEVQYDASGGGDGFAIGYRIPMRGGRSRFGVEFEHSDNSIIEEPFEALNIDSELRSFSVAFEHKLFSTPREFFKLRLNLDHRRNKTNLLGRPFSFTAGARNGVSEVNAVRFAQEWLNREHDRVIMASSIFSVGSNLVDKTTNDEGLDGRFASWQGQFRWLGRHFDDALLSVFRANVQVAERWTQLFGQQWDDMSVFLDYSSEKIDEKETQIA